MKLSLQAVVLPVVFTIALGVGLVAKEGTASAQIVEVVTPSPVVEVVGIAPSPRHVWVPGAWGFHPGRGRLWTPGRWRIGHPGRGFRAAGGGFRGHRR